MTLRTSILYSVFFLAAFSAKAQNANILHYSETSGYDHNTRANSLAMFQTFPNVTVVNDETGASFDTLSYLLTFDLIVFSNTSGNAILDSLQRHNFEAYMQNGGNLLGIHAATDTYRHSTANGNNTGVWDFYAKTIGGSVQQSPNHVAGTPLYSIYKLNQHFTVAGLPDPWAKNEEYYYWENGYLDSANQVVLNVEETVGPNGQVNSYDSTRAVSWYKTTANGNSIFYTSLGHGNSNFTTDSLFIQHIGQATDWCLSRFVGLDENAEHLRVKLFPNPANEYVYFFSPTGNKQITIYTLSGKPVKHIAHLFGKQSLFIGDLAKGLYLVEITDDSHRQVEKLSVH